MEISKSDFDKEYNDRFKEDTSNCLNIKNLNIWFNTNDHYALFGYSSTPMKIDKSDVDYFRRENIQEISEFNIRQKNRSLENRVCISVEEYQIEGYFPYKTYFLVFTLELENEKEYFTLYNETQSQNHHTVLYKFNDKYFKHFL